MNNARTNTKTIKLAYDLFARIVAKDENQSLHYALKREADKFQKDTHVQEFFLYLADLSGEGLP
jgi:hypothetical protein